MIWPSLYVISLLIGYLVAGVALDCVVTLDCVVILKISIPVPLFPMGDFHTQYLHDAASH